MLKQTLNALPSAQFNDLVFALNPPKGNIPGNPAPQSNRSMALLEWAESPAGPGLSVLEKLLGKTIATTSNTADHFVAFSISGKINESTMSEVQAFVELLRKKTRDSSIDFAFVREGSIEIILSGAAKILQGLQEIFNVGGLADTNINAVYTINNSTADARKARLVQTLRFAIGSNLAGIRAKGLAEEVHRADLLARGIDNALRNDAERIREALSELARRYDELNSQLDRARQHQNELNRELDRPLNFVRRTRLEHELEDLDREIDDFSRELEHINPNDYSYRDTLNYYNNCRNLCQYLINILDRASDFSNTLVANNLNRNSVASDLNDVLCQASEVVNELISNFNEDFLHYMDRYRLREDITNTLNRALTLVQMFVHSRNQPLSLEHADLTYTNLRNIDLSQANLTEANCSGADLTGADLTGAMFTGANVTETVFGKNEGLTDANQLDLQRRGAILLDPPDSDFPSWILR